MQTAQIVGLDIGYGYTKAYNGNKNQMVLFPSVVGFPENIRYRERVATNGGGAGNLQLDLGGIQLNTATAGLRFVGDLALDQSRITRTPQDRNRTGSDVMLTLMLAGLSELGVKGDIRLVTGLPVNWYDDRAKIVSHFAGQHQFHRCGQQKPTEVDIIDVAVIPQPVGTFYSKVLNQRGQLINQPLLDAKVGIIDIGMHTTDFTLLDNLQYIEQASTSIETAMSQVYELTARAIHDRYQIELKLSKTIEAVRAAKLTVRRQSISIADIVDPILAEAAGQIGDIAAHKWGSDGSNVDVIFITGGGASPVGSYLNARFPHNLEVLAGSETANVRGFYNYGILKWTT